MDELLDLEHAGWRSLCDGTGARYYGDLMTPTALMVLAGGSMMTRSEVTAALEEAPPWGSYSIDDPAIVELGAQVVALVYTGTGRRDDGDDLVAIMTSVYVRDGRKWKLAHFQQTPVR